MWARDFGSGVMLALIGVAVSPAPGHALDICVDSKVLEIKKDECLTRGTAVMRKYFTDTFHDGGAVFGRQGNASSAAILCDRTDKGAVFFATSSVDPKVCDENIRRLLNDF
jgi:hypothetical protein